MTQATVTNTAPRLAHSRFRPAPLAASMALLWSANAFSLPGEPKFVVPETEFQLAAGKSSVDVPVRWHQLGGDPATSVQYFVDDLQMQVRRVDPDDGDDGETTLSFSVGGDYALSVALCNADGCSESEPVTISVIDPAGRYLLEADAAASAELAAISAALEERLTYYESIYGPRETWAPEVQEDSARLAWSVIAKAVGKGVFNGMLGKAGGEGMGQIMALMGYDPDGDKLDALNKLSDSVDALHDKIDAIAAQLDEIVNQIEDSTGKAMWNSFRSSDNNLRLSVLSPIEDLFNLMNFWTEDNPPSQSLLESYVQDVSQAIRGIRNAVVGNQGTLTMLAEAHRYSEKVTNLKEYWPFVDEYREEWRAVLAQALLSLEYMRQFDDSGYADFQLESSRAIADTAVEAMWSSIGLKIPQDPVFGYVHLVGQDWIYAAEAWHDFRRPELSSEDWYGVPTRAELEPRAVAMANNYRADLNAGKSLQTWMFDVGYLGSFPYLDSPANHPTPGTLNWGSYSFNNYQVIPARTPEGGFSVAKFMDVQTNAGGRAANFDPDVVQGMAFGFELKLDTPLGGTALVATAENAFDAPDVRLLDAETGETIDYQVAGSTHTYTLDPGSAVTIQLGERAVAESSDELFGPVAEMTVILPDDRDRLQLSVD